VFTSGVPVPGNETVRINFYVFGQPQPKLTAPMEAIVQSFEYQP
jgi:hypothetical protein